MYVYDGLDRIDIEGGKCAFLEVIPTEQDASVARISCFWWVHRSRRVNIRGG